jgi:hypothetical protein
MSDPTTNPLHIAAALADQVYRRADTDFGIRAAAGEADDIAGSAIGTLNVETSRGVLGTRHLFAHG